MHNKIIITLSATCLAVLAFAQPSAQNAQTRPDSPSAGVPDATSLPSQPGAENLSYPRTVPAFGGWMAAAPEMPVSVLSFDNADQKAIDQTAEDLRILSYILKRNLENSFAGDPREYKLGVPILMNSDGHSVQASYVQGFGVVLNVKVRFPLLRPAETEPAAKTTTEDSEWETARRALSGHGSAEWREKSGTARERFDGRVVELLKKRVLEVLKNASNLRHVKPDEWVVVCFTGAANQDNLQAYDDAFRFSDGKQTAWAPADRKSPYITQRAPSTDYAPMSEDARPESSLIRTAGAQQARATVLTIRIHKRTAEAAASGSISEEQLAKEAETATYLGSAGTPGYGGAVRF